MLPQPPLSHRRYHAGPRRAQLLAWAAAKPGRFILEDDYDSEFRFATRPLPSLQGMSGANGPVVYLTTFSKSLAPGMRIACMVLPQGLLNATRAIFPCTPTPSADMSSKHCVSSWPMVILPAILPGCA